jgi:hypothetical protein
MKPSPKMQEVISAIAAKYGLNMRQQGAHVRLTMPHYDPLVIEVLHEHLVNVAHLYEPRPDIRIADPAIAFFTGYDLWVPVEVTQRIGGYRIYATLSDDMGDITGVLPTAQADLADFAEMWAENIVEQRWLEQGMVNIAAKIGVDGERRWPEPTVDDPDEDQVEAWLMDVELCEATDGCIVEVDGICPHGHPSWLRRMGLV